MVQNMISLRDNLTKENISWEDRSSSLLDVTAVFFGNHTILVENGYGTYGGYNSHNRSYYKLAHHTPRIIHKDDNKGLLDLDIDNSTHIGSLDASQVIQIIHRLILNDST